MVFTNSNPHPPLEYALLGQGAAGRAWHAKTASAPTSAVQRQPRASWLAPLVARRAATTGRSANNTAPARSTCLSTLAATAANVSRRCLLTTLKVAFRERAI